MYLFEQNGGRKEVVHITRTELTCLCYARRRKSARIVKKNIKFMATVIIHWWLFLSERNQVKCNNKMLDFCRLNYHSRNTALKENVLFVFSMLLLQDPNVYC